MQQESSNTHIPKLQHMKRRFKTKISCIYQMLQLELTRNLSKVTMGKQWAELALVANRPAHRLHAGNKNVQRKFTVS